ncbi:MAG: DUF5615 family PIN-like protein [Caldilineaceae bacterium]|nr:DUF5615 family PIN-like protein [Caldilineaceae bacterium]
MSDLKLLLDENLSPTIRDELRQRNIDMDIHRIGDDGMPPFGTPDEIILAWIETSGYVLVTNNRRSMPGHLQTHYAQGRHIPGILLVRSGATLGEIIEELWLIWQASEASEYRDRTQFIPL